MHNIHYERAHSIAISASPEKYPFLTTLLRHNMAAKASRSAELTRKLFEAVSSCIFIVLLILPEILSVLVIKVSVESVS